MLGVITTIAANCYRHRIGRPYNTPGEGLDYAEVFKFLMFNIKY